MSYAELVVHFGSRGLGIKSWQHKKMCLWKILIIHVYNKAWRALRKVKISLQNYSMLNPLQHSFLCPISKLPQIPIDSWPQKDLVNKYWHRDQDFLRKEVIQCMIFAKLASILSLAALRWSRGSMSVGGGRYPH
jgi:hypothetical protein